MTDSNSSTNPELDGFIERLSEHRDNPFIDGFGQLLERSYPSSEELSLRYNFTNPVARWISDLLVYYSNGHYDALPLDNAASTMTEIRRVREGNRRVEKILADMIE